MEPDMTGDLRTGKADCDALDPQRSSRQNERAGGDATLWQRGDGSPLRREFADPLAAVIQRDIVPALLLEFRTHPALAGSTPEAFSAQDRTEFATSALHLPPRGLITLAEHYLDIGFTSEQVLLDLLAPVARHLGVLWERDEVSFIDVTIAIQKLHQVLHAVSSRAVPIKLRTSTQPLAYLVPAPGEVHTFGLMIISEMLRQRGWRVVGGLPTPLNEILEKVSQRSFTMIGFAISADALIKPTASAIRRVRKRSKNASVRIVVGGKVCAGSEGLAEELGADGAFADAKDACNFADSIEPIVNHPHRP
jgi:MerR family transcriptional regulator, light-induced transcriptional regulator